MADEKTVVNVNTNLPEVEKAVAKVTDKASGLKNVLDTAVEVIKKGFTKENVLKFGEECILAAEAAGISAENVDEMANSFKSLKEAVGEVLLLVADVAGGTIASGLDGIVGALRQVSDWVSQFKVAVQALTLVVGGFFAAWQVAGLVEFVVNAGSVTAALSAVVKGLTAATLAKVKDRIAAVQLAAEWVAGTVAQTAATVAQWAGTAATTALGAAINFLTSPITLVVLAIGALIAIVVLLVAHWDDVKNAAAVCWEKIQEVWNIVATWFNETVVAPISGFFSGLWKGVLGFFTNLWTDIQGIWIGVSNWFNTNVVEGISGFFSGLWENITSWAQGAWDDIVAVFQGVADWFDKNLITPVTNGFKDFINGLIGFVEGFVNFFIRGINTIIGGFNKLSIKIPDNPITGPINL